MDRPKRSHCVIDTELQSQPHPLDPVEFDAETMAALVELGQILRGIHDDLVAEGFQIKDGIITPPSAGL